MRTTPKIKHTIQWEQLQKQNIPHHEELFSWYVVFYFWSCSHGMVCFVFRAVLMLSYALFFGTVLMVWYKTYHTMRTVSKRKHILPWEQLQTQNIPYHENSTKKQNIPYHENSSRNKTRLRCVIFILLRYVNNAVIESWMGDDLLIRYLDV
jgi:Ca2+/Na+ antiporter